MLTKIFQGGSVANHDDSHDLPCFTIVKSPIFCWSRPYRPYCPSLCRQVQRLMEKLDDNASLTGQCVFAGVPAEMGGPCLKWGNFTLAMAIEVYFDVANDDKMIKHP